MIPALFNEAPMRVKKCCTRAQTRPFARSPAREFTPVLLSKSVTPFTNTAPLKVSVLVPVTVEPPTPVMIALISASAFRVTAPESSSVCPADPSPIV